jgi:CubicO group peptidase (beta-lactamase class C family)
MKTLLSFLFFLLFSHLSFAASIEEVARDSIQKNEKIPGTGVSLLVFDHGKPILKKGFGLADRESNSPVTEKSLFAIGSTTKAFTALSLLMAEEKGLLDLSVPITKYLPDFSLNDASILNELNSYDLLSHRSGMPRHDLLPYVTYFSRAEIFYRMRFLDFNPKPEMGFRKGFQYNNLMYMTAGILLERVTGTSWETYIKENILNVLGMHETHADFSESMKSSALAAPYNEETRLLHKEIKNMGPAGSIYSNIDDLERWISFILNNGVLSDGSRLVSEKQWTKLFSRQTKIESPDRDMYYGLGWLMIQTEDKYVVFHNGNIDGFSTMIYLLPQKGIAVVALVNQNGSDLGSKVAADITKFLLEKKEAKEALHSLQDLARVSRNFESIQNEKRRGFVNSSSELVKNEIIWADLGGIYRNSAYGDFIIYYEGGEWKARYYMVGGAVKAMDEKTFSFPFQVQGEVFDFPAIIERKEGGGVTILLPFEPSLKPIQFERVQ